MMPTRRGVATDDVISIRENKVKVKRIFFIIIYRLVGCGVLMGACPFLLAKFTSVNMRVEGKWVPAR